LIDENGKEDGILTGNTLFIGDVGRPDLAKYVIAELTEDKLAGYLFDSLRNKIRPLSDDSIVYPNHGAGCAFGKISCFKTKRLVQFCRYFRWICRYFKKQHSKNGIRLSNYLSTGWKVLDFII